MSQPVRLEFLRRFYQREVEAIIALWCPAVLKSLPTVPETGALNSTATHIRRGARQSERTPDLVLFVASRQLLVDMSLIKRVLDQRGMIIGWFVQQAWQQRGFNKRPGIGPFA